MLKKVKSIGMLFKTISVSFKLCWKTAPLITVLRIASILISTAIPFINTYTLKSITNNLISRNTVQLVSWFAVLAITQLISAIIGKTMSYLTSLQNDKLIKTITVEIIDKTNQLDVSFFDDTTFYDMMSNVKRDIVAMPSFVWSIFSVLQTFIQFISAFVLLMSFGIEIPVLLCLSCLPNYYIDKKYSLKMYHWSRDTVKEVRQMNYYYDVLTAKHYSIDMRANNLMEYIRDKYLLQWQAWFQSKRNIVDKQFRLTFLTMFLPHGSTLLFSFVILLRIIRGDNSIGDFTYFVGVMGQLTTGTLGVISTLSEVIQQREKIQYYENFLACKPRFQINKIGFPIKQLVSLEFVNVSFSFPGSSEVVLENLSFNITQGEKIGIVGKNGSGKSTIIKLILRMYQPTSGVIKMNGKNINEYGTAEYNQLISFVLQNYVNYAFTLRENIQTTDIYRENFSDEDVIRACVNAQVNSFTEDWANGLDTYLTKSFDDMGVELSGGQWQKIALARMFYKKASLYILDEPFSSLDSESESNLFSNMLHEAHASTMILVTHKLHHLSSLDRIIVLEKGNIVDMGTHIELLSRNGIYQELYKLQEGIL